MASLGWKKLTCFAAVIFQNGKRLAIFVVKKRFGYDKLGFGVG